MQYPELMYGLRGQVDLLFNLIVVGVLRAPGGQLTTYKNSVKGTHDVSCAELEFRGLFVREIR